MNRGDSPGRSSHWVALSFLAAALLLVYGRYLVGQAPSGDDTVLQYIPYQKIVHDSVRLGDVPYWNPWTFLGRPLMADIQVGILYPPNWIHHLLPLPLGFALLLIGHAAWGLAGCYLLGRRWALSEAASALFAVLFVFSGFLTTKLLAGVVLFIYVASWLPWLLLALVQIYARPAARSVALMAIALAMSLLAGSPQITYYSWLIVLAFAFALPVAGFGPDAPGTGEASEGRRARAVVRAVRGLALVAAAFVIALALTSIQTFQTWDMIRVSYDRSVGASWDYITDGSLGSNHLGLMINPGMYGPGDDPSRYWGSGVGFSEACNYMTLWSILILVPMGAWFGLRGEAGGDDRTRGLHRRLAAVALALVIFALLMAPGRFSPVFALLWKILPGFDSFRVTARLMFGFSFCAALLAAIGLDGFRAAASRPGKRDTLIATPLLLGTLGALVLAVVYSSRESLWLLLDAPFIDIADDVTRGRTTGEFARDLLGHSVRGGAFVVLAGAALSGLGYLCSRGSAKRFGLAWAPAVLAAVELAIFSWPNQPSTPVREYAETHYPQSDLVRVLKDEADGGRVLWMDSLLDWRFDQNQPEVLRNILLMQGLADARGYDPVNARWIGEWFNHLAGLPPDLNPLGAMHVPEIAEPLLLTPMAASLVLDYNDLSAEPGLRVIGRLDFPEGPLFVHRNDDYRGLAYAAYPPGMALDLVLGRFRFDNVTPTIVAHRFKKDDRFKVIPIEEGPNRFVYETDFPEAAPLILSQSRYPGWRVQVNGSPAPIEIASHALMAVQLEAGTSRVEFSYAPPAPFGWFRTLSIATLVLIVVMLFAGRTREAVNPDPSD